MSLIDEILKHYDWDSGNTESFSYCPGFGGFLDLSQFDEHEEVVRSEAYDTYCVKYFCGNKKECLICEVFKNGKEKNNINYGG